MEKITDSSDSIIKIVIIGPESTGKSNLCDKLAHYYNTVWVPEYARRYIENLHKPYSKSDLLNIAKGQLKMEDSQIKQANKYIFCDTNLWVIKVWSEHKYGTCDGWIIDQINNRKYHLHLIMDIDLPWEPDPQREHPDLRRYFLDVYKNELDYAKVNNTLISGKGEKRLQNAISAIETFL